MSDVLVLDASAALRVVLPHEAGHAEAAQAAARAVASGWTLAAPDLFLYEVGQVMARQRGSPAERARGLHLTYELVEMRRPSIQALQRALAVAGEGKLSFYDAAYLALAEEADGLLWTEDRELLKRFPARTADTKELLRRLR